MRQVRAAGPASARHSKEQVVKPRPGVRPSPIAGQWYPDDPQRLARQIDQYIETAKLPEFNGPVVAVMAPHAGYRYSGPVAGHAYAPLRGLAPEIVVVAAPMHYPYSASILTSAHRAYATPLGEIPVDQAAQIALDEALAACGGPPLTAVWSDPEHSLEIELPFLQRVLAQPFSLLPIMVRTSHPGACQVLGQALACILAGRRALLVASTDLSHFYSQAVAEKLDAAMLHAVQAFDPLEVLALEERGEGFACGRGALAAVMWAARGLGANQAHILHYATSGQVTFEFEQVVGYAAAAFTR